MGEECNSRTGRIRVFLIFLHRPQEEPGWPGSGYNYPRRIKELTKSLKSSYPQIEFVPETVQSREKAEELLVKSKIKDIDGYLVFIIGHGTRALDIILSNCRPLILVGDLYGGSGEFLGAFSQARRDKLPMIGLTSSNFKDVVKSVHLFEVIKAMRGAKILDILDKNTYSMAAHRDTKEYSKKLKGSFGTQLITMTSDELNTYYKKANEKEAEKLTDKWIKEAIKVVEPSREEIVKSAKMYLTLKQVMQDKGVDAVTIDCLGLFYAGKLAAYPCLSYFQLNNEGSTGVCEADLDSTVTQLLMRYLTGRSGYVSDPVIDTAANQIIYCHCVAPNKVFGPDGLSNPYIIRSHTEDHKGASVQSLMPLGEKVTTVKINVKEKAVCVHQGRTVGNVEEDKACRTKLAVELDAEKMLNNWNKKGNWGWHRVTFYGDWEKQITHLGKLLGLEVFREDIA